MIKSDKSKNEARKMYVVIDIDEERRAAVVQKFVNNQIRNKKYRVKVEQIILVDKGRPQNLNTMSEILENKNDDENFNDNQGMNAENEEYDLEGNIENTPPRHTRNKPRLDYSAFNETGNRKRKRNRISHYRCKS